MLLALSRHLLEEGAGSGTTTMAGSSSQLGLFPSSVESTSDGDNDRGDSINVPTGAKCPECSGYLLHQEGCLSCPDCGYNKCE